MNRLLGSTALALILAGAAGAAHAQDTAFCSDGWIAADADGDGYVSAEENAAATNGVYSGFDADGNGVISHEEYTACVTTGVQAGIEAGVTAGDEEAFMSADTNGDGFIDADEYRLRASSAYQSALEAGDEAARAERDRWMVARAGADAAAEISADEAAARASAHFRMFDSDGDGKIAREEWTGLSGESALSGNMAMGGRFDMMDEDGDGQVSAEEFEAARSTAYEAAGQAAREEGVTTDDGVPVYPYWFWVN